MSKFLEEQALRCNCVLRGTRGNCADGCEISVFKLDETPSPIASNVSSVADVSMGSHTTPPNSKRQVGAGGRPMWSLDDFIIIRKLNEGRFGKVYLAREKQSKCAVVLKCISKEMIRFHSLAHQLQREVELQEYAGRYHHNVLRLFAYFWDDVRIVLVLEYADGGTLQDLLDRQKQREQRSSLPDDKVRTILQQLLSALAFLHERDIIHRDIKPDNILFHGDKLLLADFSWAVRLNRCDPRYSRRHTICGTLDYLSPEQVLKRGCTTKADVWAVGVVAYRMLCGFLPFEMLDARDVCSCIATGAVRYPSQLSPMARHFLRGLLQVDETLRFTCCQALNHPFMRVTCSCRINNYPSGVERFASAGEPVLQRLAALDGANSTSQCVQQAGGWWCCNHVRVLKSPEQGQAGRSDCRSGCGRNKEGVCDAVRWVSGSDAAQPLVTAEGLHPTGDGSSDTNASLVTISPLRSTECMHSLSNVSTPSIASQAQSEWLHSASPISRTSAVAVGTMSKCSRDDIGTSSHGVSCSGIRLHFSASEGSGQVTGHHHTQLGTSAHSPFALVPPVSPRCSSGVNNGHRVAATHAHPGDREEGETADCALKLCFDDEADDLHGWRSGSRAMAPGTAVDALGSPFHRHH